MSIQQQSNSGSDTQTTWIDGLDRSPASASPFSRPNETGQIRGREYDAATVDGRKLSTRDSPKRGEKSGRRLGSQISANDCKNDRWERLRKRDEKILTFDADRYDAEGDSYLDLHRGAGVETDGDERIRTMTLLTIVSNVANELNTGGVTENRARTITASLSKSETNGRKFEATATASLVVAGDQRIATQIGRIDAEKEEIEQIQSALRRAQSPAKRFRILNNIQHITDDERIQTILQRRLDATTVEENHDFSVKTTVESIGWSQ